MQWRTNVNGSCLTRQQYRFAYDNANRLLSANHFTYNGTAWVNTNNYSESNISYDLNGNLKTYNRRGQMPDLSFNVIDNLTYIYGDAARPDRLTNVSDAGNAVKGFKYTSGAANYQYDLNGNLTQDNHKGLSLQYNFLNLPNYYSNAGGSDVSISYTADGEKLNKISSAGTRNYVSGIEYLGANLDAIYHGEGRCTPNGASAFFYEYTIKDHLGNARVNFRANGTAVTFLQELHYYPFGMVMEGIGTAQVTNNAYKYNGKELNEDLGLNLSDYGARWYDAALGRWWSVDPLGEKSLSISSYVYVSNNPMILIDPTGMFELNNRLPEASEMLKEEEAKIDARSDLIKQVDKALKSTVHIVQLKGANSSTIKGAKKTLEACASAAGLNVIFQLEDPDDFDITQMPLTDVVAVVGGNNKETANYIVNNIDKGYLSQKFQDQLPEYATSNPLDNPEKTDSGDGWGYVIATTTNMGRIDVYDPIYGTTTTGSAMNRLCLKTESDALAFSILHGMGHTSGLGHPSGDYGIMRTGMQGSLGIYMAQFHGDLVAAVKDTFNPESNLKRSFYNRFKVLKP